MNETLARIAGSILGLVVAATVVLYLFAGGLSSKGTTQKNVLLDRDNSGNPTSTAPPRAGPDPAASETSKTVEQLRQLAEQQAKELAALKLAAEANRAMAIIRRKRAVPDYSRPEIAKLMQLSRQNLAAEIQVALREIANYAAGGTFAPERHFEFYRRANILYDVPKLLPKENAWLDRAVKELNEMAVRHAERSLTNGELGEVVRTAIALDEWAFRLSDIQENRYISALNVIAAGASSR